MMHRIRSLGGSLPWTVLILACWAAAAAAGEPQGVYQDNVVIVLDASGSMNKPMTRAPSLTRMGAAKQALLQVTSRLPRTANVGLLVFSASNLREDWVYPLGVIDTPRMQAAIGLPSPGGATPLGEYLRQGANALLAQRQAQKGYGTYRLLVVTDGEATDMPHLLAVFPEVLARGITVDVIGVDMLEEHTLAKRANSYRRADDPEALVRAVAEVFAEVGSGPKDDRVDSEQFALIQGLPDGAAAAMLEALTSTGNEPIGVGGTPSPTPIFTAPSALPGGSTPSSAKPGFFKSPLVVFLVVLVIISILRAKLRQATRSPRHRQRPW